MRDKFSCYKAKMTMLSVLIGFLKFFDIELAHQEAFVERFAITLAHFAHEVFFESDLG